MGKTKIPNKLPKFSVLLLFLVASVAAVALILWLFDGMTPRDGERGGGDPAFRQYILQYAR